MYAYLKFKFKQSTLQTILISYIRLLADVFVFSFVFSYALTSHIQKTSIFMHLFYEGVSASFHDRQ